MTPEVATNLLEIALAKCTIHSEQVWVGCLTNSEQKMLVELGAVPEIASQYQQNLNCLKVGAIHSGYFYFTATGKLKDLLAIINGHGRCKKC